MSTEATSAPETVPSLTVLPGAAPGAGDAPSLDAAARHGLFGRALDILEPSTEAEPAAILTHLLVGFGAMCGPGPHLLRGTQRMPAKTFAVVVGASARARKGTSWGDASAVLRQVDPKFFAADGRYATGLSSGEGLIAYLRDQPDYGPGPFDEPTGDPRLLLIEPEWGKVLRQNRRQGNTLSATVREAWDTGTLQVLTRTDPLRATNHHVGIVGHVTVDELLAEMDSVSAANGFANRHLFIYVERRKILPNPPAVDTAAIEAVAEGLRTALGNARSRGELTLSAAAEQLWASMYLELEESPETVGIASHLVQRGPAQILRLALIYALADGRDVVGPEHLEAAAALWEFAHASVLHVFAARMGDPLADRLLAAVRDAGDGGLAARAVYEVLGGNVSKDALDRAVTALASAGLLHQVRVPAGPRGGRPSRVLIAAPA